MEDKDRKEKKARILLPPVQEEDVHQALELPSLTLHLETKWPEDEKLFFVRTDHSGRIGFTRLNQVLCTLYLTAHHPHPNIGRIWSFDTAQGGTVTRVGSLPFIPLAMDLDLPSRVSILYQVTRAVAHMHAHGVMHSDLGSDAVRLFIHPLLVQVAMSPHSQLRSLHLQQASRLPLATRERLREALPSSSSSDLWALGVLALLLLSEVQAVEEGTPFSQHHDYLQELLAPPGKSSTPDQVRRTLTEAGLASALSCSAHAGELLTSLFLHDVRQRPTAREMLQHPFFTQDWFETVIQPQVEQPFPTPVPPSPPRSVGDRGVLLSHVSSCFRLLMPAVAAASAAAMELGEGATYRPQIMELLSFTTWHVNKWLLLHPQAEAETRGWLSCWWIVAVATIAPTHADIKTWAEGVLEAFGHTDRAWSHLATLLRSRWHEDDDPLFLCRQMLYQQKTGSHLIPILMEVSDLLWAMTLARPLMAKSASSAQQLATALLTITRDVVEHTERPALVDAKTRREWHRCYQPEARTHEMWRPFRPSGEARGLIKRYFGANERSTTAAVATFYFLLKPQRLEVMFWNGAASPLGDVYVHPAKPTPAGSGEEQIRAWVREQRGQIWTPALIQRLRQEDQKDKKDPFWLLGMAWNEVLILEMIQATALGFWFSTGAKSWERAERAARWYYAAIHEAKSRLLQALTPPSVTQMKEWLPLVAASIQQYQASASDQALILLDAKGLLLGHARLVTGASSVQLRAMTPSVFGDPNQAEQVLQQMVNAASQYGRKETKKEWIDVFPATPIPPLLQRALKAMGFTAAGAGTSFRRSLAAEDSVAATVAHVQRHPLLHGLDLTALRTQRHLLTSHVHGTSVLAVLTSPIQTVLVLGESHQPWRQFCPPELHSSGIDEYLEAVLRDNQQCFFDFLLEDSYDTEFMQASRRAGVKASGGHQALWDRFQLCFSLQTRDLSCDIPNLAAHFVDLRLNDAFSHMHMYAMYKFTGKKAAATLDGKTIRDPELSRLLLPLQTHLAGMKQEVEEWEQGRPLALLESLDVIQDELKHLAPMFQAKQGAALQRRLEAIRPVIRHQYRAALLKLYYEVSAAVKAQLVPGAVFDHRVWKRMMEPLHGLEDSWAEVMDLYAMGRAFHDYSGDKRKPGGGVVASNVWFFGGSFHSEKYIRFLLSEEGGTFQLQYFQRTESHCIKLPPYPQLKSWFKSSS